MMATTLSHLTATNARVESLRADFEGLEKLNDIINDVLKRLQARGEVQQAWSTMNMQNFDGWFEPIVRKELGKVLGIVRNNAVDKARKADAGSASTAIQRRMYRDRLGGNINFASGGKRITYKKREYTPGIKKPRHVGDRTKKINEYYGPDRSFILRFLEGGTDIRTATSYGPTGKRSRATYGNRGSIGARSFFGSVDADMRTAANQLGTTLVNYVEKWIEEVFND
jgi:hypothetical protein